MILIWGRHTEKNLVIDWEKIEWSNSLRVDVNVLKFYAYWLLWARPQLYLSRILVREFGECFKGNLTEWPICGRPWLVQLLVNYHNIDWDENWLQGWAIRFARIDIDVFPITEKCLRTWLIDRDDCTVFEVDQTRSCYRDSQSSVKNIKKNLL